MKPFLRIAFAVAVCSVSCDPAGIPLRARIRFPAPPEAWALAVGSPEWSLRWYGSDGTIRRADGAEDGFEIELAPDRPSPVLAYPYWPASGVEIGTAYPAGTVHPYGWHDGTIELDWVGGVCAVFFREMAAAGGDERNLPENFDWPRFRKLLGADAPPPEIGSDPWAVDWRSVAARTRGSGFDRRRLTARPSEAREFASPSSGPWACASPFLPAPAWALGERASLAVSGEPDSRFCADGTLRFDSDASAWFPARGGLERGLPLR